MVIDVVVTLLAILAMGLVVYLIYKRNKEMKRLKKNLEELQDSYHTLPGVADALGVMVSRRAVLSVHGESLPPRAWSEGRMHGVYGGKSAKVRRYVGRSVDGMYVRKPGTGRGESSKRAGGLEVYEKAFANEDWT